MTSHLAPNDAPWMSDPARPCAPPDDPLLVRDHADRWHPRPKYAERATRLCAPCPTATRTACLAYALANPELEGVWGGTTWQQRVRVRKGATA